MKGYIVKKTRGDDKVNGGGLEGNAGGEIILKDAYEWEVIGWRVPLVKFSKNERYNLFFCINYFYAEL